MGKTYRKNKTYRSKSQKNENYEKRNNSNEKYNKRLNSGTSDAAYLDLDTIDYYNQGNKY